MPKKYTVEVTQTFEVTLENPEIFSEDFNKDFSKVFWNVDCNNDHVEHIAQMEARGLIGYDTFVEGYGKLSELGITVKDVSQEEYVVEEQNV